MLTLMQPRSSSRPQKASLVNWLPWSVLKISGRPLLKASSGAPFQGRDTEAHFQSIGEPPGQHVSAVPVHNGHEIKESPGHGQVGDVGCPNLIDPVDCYSFEQVRVYPVFRCRLAGIGLAVDGFQPHRPHQSPYPLAVDLMPLSPEPGRHPARTIIRASSDTVGLSDIPPRI